MNKKLTRPQIKIIRTSLFKIRDMNNDDDLKSYRDSISVSDAAIEIKEIILEGIGLRLNRKELTNLALIDTTDLKDGESY